MLFEHVKIPELQFDLEAQTGDSGRLYLTPSGKKYPSVTTVLSYYNSKAIAEWRERVGNEEAKHQEEEPNFTVYVKSIF